MELRPGAKIGPYEIVSPLGKGGMGEVWRARDPRLGRDVAIKVSNEQFSDRFEKEARAIAALNHANICTLFDVGPNYLVIELIEGPTLADRIREGPIPLHEALAIARQIADALEAAHEIGIVHRDLKPGNIKIRPDGSVKVLDFGLAKLGTTAITSGDTANSPTLTMGMTEAGMILGTAAYMAPEQARGKTVDKRADIWAFGVVLFEVLTGKQLFEGDNPSDILAGVLKSEPDLNLVPPKARRLLAACLEKDPRKRLRDIADWERLLETPEPQSAPPPTRPRANLAWAVTGVLALLLAADLFSRFNEKPPAAPDFTFTITPPPGLKIPSAAGQSGAPHISPNGEFVLSGNVLFNLRTGLAESPGLLRNPGTMGFWSPDSKMVAKPTPTGFQRVHIPLGSLESSVSFPYPTRGGTWASTGALLLSGTSELNVLLPGASAFVPMKTPGLGAGYYLQPEFIEGGPDFLFLHRTLAEEEFAIYLGTLNGDTVANPVRLMANATAARFSPSNSRILFVRDDNLYSRKLDRKQRVLVGDPELVQNRVASAPAYGLADFSVSHSGVLVWRAGGASKGGVVALDRTGKQVEALSRSYYFHGLRLSPDQKHLLGRASLQHNSFILDTEGTGIVRVGPIVWDGWSPDGSSVIGIRDTQIVAAPVQRPSEIKVLANAPGITFLEDISPDGRTAIYSSDTYVLHSVPLDGAGAGKPTPVVDNGDHIRTAKFSPDGRWIVYRAVSPDNRTLGIFVQPFGGPGFRRQISATGSYPIWRGDGKEIIFLDAGNKIHSVSVSGSGADLRFGTPQLLFQARLSSTTVSGLTPIAISRDGSRIYLPQQEEQPEDANVIHVRTKQ